MIHKFTDRNYAVMYDCLTLTRERIQAEGKKTPDIDEAIAKLGGWAHPTGCEFIVLTGVDMWLILGANGDPDYDEAQYQAALKREREAEASA